MGWCNSAKVVCYRRLCRDNVSIYKRPAISVILPWKFHTCRLLLHGWIFVHTNWRVCGQLGGSFDIWVMFVRGRRRSYIRNIRKFIATNVVESTVNSIDNSILIDSWSIAFVFLVLFKAEIGAASLAQQPHRLETYWLAYSIRVPTTDAHKWSVSLSKYTGYSATGVRKFKRWFSKPK